MSAWSIARCDMSIALFPGPFGLFMSTKYPSPSMPRCERTFPNQF